VWQVPHHAGHPGFKCFVAETSDNQEELADELKKHQQLRDERLCKVCFCKSFEEPAVGNILMVKSLIFIQTPGDLSKTNE